MIFTSYSGDKFHIPDKQYDREKAIYNEAVIRKDEKVMLLLEEGYTGWEYIEW